MITTLVWAAIIILFIWLAALTFLFYSLYTHYNKLIKGTDPKNLKEILEDLLETAENNKKNIAFLKIKYDTILEDGKFHIQKIGLSRFNPFKDTGGDQSFILSLLDAKNTGVIISGLYSRAGTRWYAKRVEKGKGVEHELSDEEIKSLTEATSAKK